MRSWFLVLRLTEVVTGEGRGRGDQLADCLDAGARYGTEGVGEGVGPLEAAGGDGVLQDLKQDAVGACNENKGKKLPWRTEAVG